MQANWGKNINVETIGLHITKNKSPTTNINLETIGLHIIMNNIPTNKWGVEFKRFGRTLHSSFKKTNKDHNTNRSTELTFLEHTCCNFETPNDDARNKIHYKETIKESNLQEKKSRYTYSMQLLPHIPIFAY